MMEELPAPEESNAPTVLAMMSMPLGPKLPRLADLVAAKGIVAVAEDAMAKDNRGSGVVVPDALETSAVPSVPTNIPSVAMVGAADVLDEKSHHDNMAVVKEAAQGMVESAVHGQSPARYQEPVITPCLPRDPLDDAAGEHESEEARLPTPPSAANGESGALILVGLAEEDELECAVCGSEACVVTIEEVPVCPECSLTWSALCEELTLPSTPEAQRCRHDGCDQVVETRFGTDEVRVHERDFESHVDVCAEVCAMCRRMHDEGLWVVCSLCDTYRWSHMDRAWIGCDNGYTPLCPSPWAHRTCLKRHTNRLLDIDGEEAYFCDGCAVPVKKSRPKRSKARKLKAPKIQEVQEEEEEEDGPNVTHILDRNGSGHSARYLVRWAPVGDEDAEETWASRRDLKRFRSMLEQFDAEHVKSLYTEAPAAPRSRRPPRARKPPPKPSRGGKPQNNAWERQKEYPAATDGWQCVGCGTKRTPLRRQGPMGARTLCNACGLRYNRVTRGLSLTKPKVGTKRRRSEDEYDEDDIIYTEPDTGQDLSDEREPRAKRRYLEYADDNDDATPIAAAMSVSFWERGDVAPEEDAPTRTGLRPRQGSVLLPPPCPPPAGPAIPLDDDVLSLDDAERSGEDPPKHKTKTQVADTNKESKGDRLTCPVCLDRQKNVIFQCGHSTCTRCSEDLDSCPLCRSKIRRRGPLYL